MMGHQRALARMNQIFTKDEMKRITAAKNGVVRIDLHGMNCCQARRFLKNIINVMHEAGTLQIIHGYNQGTALLTMIRTSFVNRHIKEMFLDKHNGGVTYLQVA